jgi:hypothetical protein
MNETKKPRHIRAVIERLLFLALWIVSSILLMRIVFFLLGANPAAPFIEWLYSFSELFVAPFSGIFPTPQYNTSVLDLASVTAICIYFIGVLAIVKLLNVTNVTR